MGYQDEFARGLAERRGNVGPAGGAANETDANAGGDNPVPASDGDGGSSTGSGGTDLAADLAADAARDAGADSDAGRARSEASQRAILSARFGDWDDVADDERGSRDMPDQVRDDGLEDQGEDDFPSPNARPRNDAPHHSSPAPPKGEGDFVSALPDSSPPVSAPPLNLPPGYRLRAGGWSRRKMVDFLEALAATCSVEQASQTVSMSRSAAYRLRARLAGTPFDLAWEAALENGLRQVAHAALDRAVNGFMQPVFYRGEQVGERRVFNERLTWLMLSNADKIGRSALAREHGLNDWDGLLDRVEKGELDWEQSAVDAAQRDPMPDTLKNYIATSSEYGSEWTAQAALDIAAFNRQQKKRGAK